MDKCFVLKKKKKLQVTKAEVVVTTYEFIRNHQKAKTIEKWGKLPHLSKVKWHVIVVDEAHHINNNSSQVAKVVKQKTLDCFFFPYFF